MSVIGAAGQVLRWLSTSAFTATPTLGTNASVAGTLGLANGGGSGATITLKNLGATAAYNYNFPATAGATGQIETSAGGVAASNTWSNIASLLTAGTGVSLSGTTNATINCSNATTGAVALVNLMGRRSPFPGV